MTDLKREVEKYWANWVNALLPLAAAAQSSGSKELARLLTKSFDESVRCLACQISNTTNEAPK